ncbi:efflux RND transporter permease subunit [Micrococcaceae bacterium Sec5.7]
MAALSGAHLPGWRGTTHYGRNAPVGSAVPAARFGGGGGGPRCGRRLTAEHAGGRFPEFAPPQVEIQTEALGLSAAEVEQLITSPMEADLLNGVAWLDAIRSKSIPGLSSIQLVFRPGTDILRAPQLVAERLTQARPLPNVRLRPYSCGRCPQPAG